VFCVGPFLIIEGCGKEESSYIQCHLIFQSICHICWTVGGFDDVRIKFHENLWTYGDLVLAD